MSDVTRFRALDGEVRIYPDGVVVKRHSSTGWHEPYSLRLTTAQRALVLARLPAVLEARRAEKLGNWPARVFRPLPKREAAVLRECL